MYLTGIGDEAGTPIEAQIKALHELGWTFLEARNVGVTGFPSGNIHDIPDRAFDLLCEKLKEGGVRVCCFGSAIANWGKKIDEPFDSSLAEARRALPRMLRLGTRLIRIMSFAVCGGNEQKIGERVARLRELTRMFLAEGIQPVHENCMNYGGMGWPYTLELLEKVPGLKLVFDTGNPLFNEDRSKPAPYPKQDAWEFYSHVKEHIAHVHVKDVIWDPHKGEKGEAVYVYPGEGHGQVRKILKDLLQGGYDAGISIEPHMAVVFHESSVKASEETQFQNFVEYGRRLETLIAGIRAEVEIERQVEEGRLLAK